MLLAQAECDVSVSRLPGLETFLNFLVVLVSVSENLVSEKSLGISIKKFGLGKKVLISVTENLVSKKKLQRKVGQKLLEAVCRGP